MQQAKTVKKPVDNTLRAGWMITFTACVAFIMYGIFDMLIPLWGEESYDGTTYAQLVSSQPKLANLFWHDSVLYGSAIVLVSLMIAILAWRDISRGSKLAWALASLWTVGLFVSGLVAHIAIADTSFSHVGYATILLLVLFTGLGISSISLFRKTKKGVPL
jgi:hypothetical protein